MKRFFITVMAIVLVCMFATSTVYATPAAGTPIRVGDDEAGNESIYISNIVSTEQLQARIEGLTANITVVNATAPVTVTMARHISVFNVWEDRFVGNGFPIMQMHLPSNTDIHDYFAYFETNPSGMNITTTKVPLATGEFSANPNVEFHYAVRAGSTIVLQEGVYMVSVDGSFGTPLLYIVVGGGGENYTPQPAAAPPPGSRVLRFGIDSTSFADGGVTGSLEAAPFIANDRTMVPLRVIADALGATNLTFNDGVITFIINNQNFAMTVGQELPNNMGAPVIVEGRTFVPLGFIVNEMGATARWDAAARAAYIYVG